MPSYQRVRVSADQLYSLYNRLVEAKTAPGFTGNALQEVANGFAVVNALHGLVANESSDPIDLEISEIRSELVSISPDFNDRWQGALYSLNPANPDATRHFCSSSREIISGVLDLKAPNVDVLAWDADCAVTRQGKPTRGSKIRFCLSRRGISSNELTEFADANVKDLNSLLDDLNSGTHGTAGKFTLAELRSIKTRVEDAILFVCKLA